MFTNDDPVTGHLWYLFAMIAIYLMLAALCQLTGRREEPLRSLYPLGMAGLVALLVMDLFMNASGIHVSYLTYRNAVAMGLPMFLMGDCVREASDGAAQNADSSLRADVAIVLLGALLTLLQELGIGKSELPVGSILSACGLLRLSVSARPAERGLTRVLGNLPLADASLAIYVVHPLVCYALRCYVEPFASLGDRLSTRLTVTVITVSVAIGFAYGFAKRLLARMGKPA